MEKESDTVYILQHVHQFDGSEAITIIGTFSSYENACQAREQVSVTEEFEDHLDSLYIASYRLDKIHWQEWKFPTGRNSSQDYFAILHAHLSVPETGYEHWSEEFHVISALSLAEAQAKAQFYAYSQATEYCNESNQLVVVHPAKVVTVEPFLSTVCDGPIAQRPLNSPCQGEPP